MPAAGESGHKQGLASVQAAEPLGWLDRACRWRDRLIGNERFQRFSASFPLTRWAARRQADRLFDLCAGFVYAQVLRAAIELKLFDLVAEQPLTLVDLAGRLDLSIASTERLLRAAVALGLIERRSGGRYGLSMMGAALQSSPGIAAMVEHHALLYIDLADPVALLRRDGHRDTGLAQYWAYAGRTAPDALSAEDVAAYSDLMAISQRMLSGDILDAYPFGRARRLLDVGGGDGTFLRAVAERAPNLELHLFDLPAVVERASARFVAAGLSGRTTATGGNFFADPLPSGADLVTLVRVTFDHDDQRVLTLLRSIRAALAPGGTLLIAEPLAGTPGAEAITDAYYGFYLLAMGRGQTRSLAHLTRLLKATGFSRIRNIPTRRPFLTALVAAQ